MSLSPGMKRVAVVGGLAAVFGGFMLLAARKASAAGKPATGPQPSSNPNRLKTEPELRCTNWTPRTSPTTTQIAQDILNGQGELPYKPGAVYYQYVEDGQWRFRMGKNVTWSGDGVATDVCVGSA